MEVDDKDSVVVLNQELQVPSFATLYADTKINLNPIWFVCCGIRKLNSSNKEIGTLKTFTENQQLVLSTFQSLNRCQPYPVDRDWRLLGDKLLF